MQIETLKQEFLRPEFILGTIIRHRWFLIVPLMLAMAIGSYLAITLPKIYEAQTLIIVQSQRVPTNYVQSVVSSEVEERINTISQEILSRSNLEKIIAQYNMFSNPEQENMFLEDKVASLRSNITVQVTSGQQTTNSFSITYRGEEPEIVMSVTNALATYFIDENLRFREAQATGTSDFLDAELNTMRKRLETQEKAVEMFRSEYMGELPEQLDSNLNMLDRLQEQLNQRQESLMNARSRLTTLQTQASAGLLAGQAAGGAGGAGRAQQPDPLDPEALQAELARLQSRYTDRHPDIIKIKQQIKDLDSKDTASGSSTPVRRLEPVQIREVRQEINNIAADISRIQSEIYDYQKRVESTPKREQELMALQRDYDNLQASYSSLLNRKLEAEISVNMERKQKGEQFRVIDRASLPKRPVEPNMKMLFLITIAAGLVVGAGIIFLIEYLNAGFRSTTEMEITLGLPTLALIPLIENHRTRLIRQVNLVATGIALLTTSAMLAVFAALSLRGVEETFALISKVKNLVL